MENFLRIDKVTKSYGSLEVLHDIDIGVERGEFLVLVGPSGCGKSTLLNVIAGLEDITSGVVSIEGSPMNGVHPSRRNIAMVFQSYALYPNMTVAQNITFGLEMHGIEKSKRLEAMSRVAEMLQIGHLLKRKPGQLSGGQRQRVAMGRALVRDPDVFLFDEPLSNLDAKLRVDMRTEIKKLHQNLGTTIVYVTHDQIEAMTLATRIAVMKDGYIQQFGTPKEIYDAPENLFVATFMGSPSMNLVPIQVVEADGRLFAESKNAMQESVRLPFASPSSKLRSRAGKNAILGIRPEAITDPAGADRNATHLAEIISKVVVIEPAGSDTFVSTILGGKNCNARMRADVQVRPNEDIPFTVNMEKAIVFDPESEKRIS